MYRLLSVLMLLSCVSKNHTVEERLRSYIDLSFHASAGDKDRLLGFLTADVHDRLASWSEDQFREAFVESKRELLKVTIREFKKIGDDEVAITYELELLDYGKHKKTPCKVTQKKLCQMVRRNQVWLIAEVRSLKELIEYQDELSLP